MLGRVVEARRVITVQGTDQLGVPPQSVVAQLDRIDDLSRLERLLPRILTADSWVELLASEPGP
jgi:hypothetical protein